MVNIRLALMRTVEIDPPRPCIVQSQLRVCSYAFADAVGVTHLRVCVSTVTDDTHHHVRQADVSYII